MIFFHYTTAMLSRVSTIGDYIVNINAFSQ